MEQEITSHDFAQGFNNAYLLGAHEPELLTEITQMVNPDSDYFDGFFSGKQQWEHDQRLQQLEQLRGDEYEMEQER